MNRQCELTAHLGVYDPGARFINRFPSQLNLMEISFYSFLDSNKMLTIQNLYMTRQLCWRGMCTYLLPSDGQQWNYSSAKFRRIWIASNNSSVKLARALVHDYRVMDLCHHWFRWWFRTYSVPSHYPNQRWHIVSWIGALGTNLRTVSNKYNIFY